MCDNLHEYWLHLPEKKKRQKGLLFFCETPWWQCVGFVTPGGPSFTSCSGDIKHWIHWLSWTTSASVVCVCDGVCVCPLLWPRPPACWIHCYVNSSKICSYKSHNPPGCAAGSRFIIFFPSLSLSHSRPAEGLCKAGPADVKTCPWSGRQEESGWGESLNERWEGEEGGTGRWKDAYLLCWGTNENNCAVPRMKPDGYWGGGFCVFWGCCVWGPNVEITQSGLWEQIPAKKAICGTVGTWHWEMAEKKKCQNSVTWKISITNS